MTQMPPPEMPTTPVLVPHRGPMILTFGILSFVCCAIFGVVAWIMGNGDLQAMRAGQMDPAGEGLTQAGKICGMVSVLLNVAIIGLYVVFIVIALIAGALGAGGP